ncbi:hypothetical protein PHMEG_00010140 [Phytophthora megakarya]|uniref:Reverse transcriptase domain-containing protein n=1 Tax=Phytophthora megakarya TaxID=4795 RepID=A0A225WG73_9STRA|nr:hypothetical protein PHMEG_00010140 [Phytophthora megakarya]
MVFDTMSGITKYSAIDLMGGFYQILMREGDVPLTAGFKNAPATFNRMVSNQLIYFSLRPTKPVTFLPRVCTSYLDDIFIHRRAEDGMTDVEVHLDHLREVFEVMRQNKFNADLKKRIFCAPEIPVLGSYVSKEGVRADPEKIEAMRAWPSPNGPEATSPVDRTGDVPPPLLEELRGNATTIVAVAEDRCHVAIAVLTPSRF